MVAPARLYVDVNGTDYSSKVLSVNVQRKLSDVGEAQVTVMNKAGAYKSTFSEQQRVAISVARGAFTNSDYFTGTDAAAIDGTKWTLVRADASNTATISGNKASIYCHNAADYIYARTNTTLSPPYYVSLWAKTDTAAGDPIYIIGANTAFNTAYWYLEYLPAHSHWHIVCRQAGAPAEVVNGGTFAVNTWYFICIYVTSTTVTVEIYNADGSTNWKPAAQTFDSLTSQLFGISVQNGIATTLYDSVLINAGRPEQLFEGTIDKIEYKQSPDTITLHCVDDAIELERQIDDAYGRVTATSTASYGATEDFGAMLNNLLPSGWTYTVPDMAWHDNQTVNVNTRRLTAINELVANSGYLGWYVLPMKHIVAVMPSYSSAPDSWHEGTAGWTATASTVATNAAAVDGSFSLKHTSDGNVGLKKLYRAVNVSLTTYRFIDFYYGTDSATANAQKVRIYTDTATPKYWEHTLSDNAGLIVTPVASEFWHCRVALPDTNGSHIWVATGSPSAADAIVRLEFEFNDTTGASVSMFTDSCYFHAQQNTTSKYTISGATGVTRQLTKPRCYSSIIMLTTFGTATFSDATLATLSGTRDYVYTDYTITTQRQTVAMGYNKLARQAYNLNGEPITATLMNPGDTYNVMLGDTLTLTVTNFNLSSATRILGARTDTINNAWTTTVTLIAIPPNTPVAELWEITKNKRYT